AAAEASLAAAFLCAGQSCTAGERFLVHEAVHDEFVEALAAAVAREIRLGDPFARETTMGPLNNEATAAKMDSHVSDALDRGATVVSGGARATGFPTQLYWEATVLDHVTEEMDVAREETFGPVVPVTTISGDEEALQIANGSPYGLLCAVWTRDLARGLRFAEAVDAGWVNVNESTNYWESHLPFGGRAGKSSGVGRVGGRHVMEAFTEPKTVVFGLT
ncbi:MAG: aldehyde dehydrogenase family protein, partial [Actinobacteria bacterium]|nr:aldehyde dehydrogenase family protein [Actinomycetota bacterium]